MKYSLIVDEFLEWEIHCPEFERDFVIGRDDRLHGSHYIPVNDMSIVVNYHLIVENVTHDNIETSMLEDWSGVIDCSDDYVKVEGHCLGLNTSLARALNLTIYAFGCKSCHYRKKEISIDFLNKSDNWVKDLDSLLTKSIELVH
jgi:hypothetical protein